MASARGIEPLSFVGISGRGVYDYSIRMERFMGAFAEDNRLVNGDRADYGVCYRCSCN